MSGTRPERFARIATASWMPREMRLTNAITKAEPGDATRLHEIWEGSVRATHHFMDECAIEALSRIVRQVLLEFLSLYCVRDDQGVPYAFMGVADKNIEMLFVDPAFLRRGAGRRLVEYAMTELAATTVDVNEQNTQAHAFYRKMGFQQVGRSELDSQGNQHPILHLRLG